MLFGYGLLYHPQKLRAILGLRPTACDLFEDFCNDSTYFLSASSLIFLTCTSGERRGSSPLVDLRTYPAIRSRPDAGRPFLLILSFVAVKLPSPRAYAIGSLDVSSIVLGRSTHHPLGVWAWDVGWFWFIFFPQSSFLPVNSWYISTTKRCPSMGITLVGLAKLMFGSATTKA